jgi:uncharacterized protein YbbC (DUF1343 family)
MKHLNFAVCTIISIVFFNSFSPLFAATSVATGAQVLHESGYTDLVGKRVGLITNQSAVVNGTHVIDLMHASGKVRIDALFAPEHGLRGLEEDGVRIPMNPTD